ncbi:hypothetical protein HOLleu_34913 [Holothuria leucospilota]|uniref:Uncharacterized protein n=1 Tax=Holothuria leucospilota TaxID=206669 RepID=A0A9Q0YLX7_HOLLE|nr:hypothetical protein HOLleu_34913 [Holothuria leucospilota]
MLTRLNATDDIDVYFKTFVNLAKIYGRPEAKLTARLAPGLTGKARSAYASLSVEECNDYPTLKRVVLAKYEISAESYRVAFRSRYKRLDEGLREWISDLGHQFDGWLEYAGVQYTDAKGLRELMVIDQALSKLPPDILAIYLKDRNPLTSKELTGMADQLVANPGGPNYWKRKKLIRQPGSTLIKGRKDPQKAVELSKEGDAQKGPMEELTTLNGSCGGYIRRLGREYKEIEVPLTDVCNYEVVVRKVEILKQLFNSYESKFNEYYSFLEGSAAEDAYEKFNAQEANYKKVCSRVAEWIAEIKGKVSPRRSKIGSRASEEKSVRSNVS